jgi:hypothetical protein
MSEAIMFLKKLVICVFTVLIVPNFLWGAAVGKGDAKITKTSNSKKAKKTGPTSKGELPLLKDPKSTIVREAIKNDKANDETPTNANSNTKQSNTDEPIDDKSNEDRSNGESRKSSLHRQWVMSVASWRENSILTKQGRKIKINTLNVAGRIDRLVYFAENRLYFNFGFLAGQSENMNAESDFTYFQRQVMLSGLDFQLGGPFFRRGGSEVSISLGGLARVINHALPGSDYKFTTATRFVPLVCIDFTWMLFQSLFFHQSLGTTGLIGDTFWSAGLGLDL